MSIKISFMHYTKLARVTLTVVSVLNFKKFELVCIFSGFFCFVYIFLLSGEDAAPKFKWVILKVHNRSFKIC